MNTFCPPNSSDDLYLFFKLLWVMDTNINMINIAKGMLPKETNVPSVHTVKYVCRTVELAGRIRTSMDGMRGTMRPAGANH